MAKETKINKGTKVLMICGIIAMVIIVLCVFFPDEFFGLFIK